MRTHRILLRFVLVAVLLALAFSGLPAAAAPQPLPPAAPPLATEALEAASPVVLAEVMPKPAAGGAEWVELVNGQPAGVTLFVPLVLKGVPPGVNTTTAPAAPIAGISLDGWQITDHDGHTYTIPAALPDVPPGARVLIYFDGLGAGQDDYDFSDGLATLHTSAGLVNVFEDAADQVGLYRTGAFSAATVADFLAWGAPPAEAAAHAETAGLWLMGWYKTFEKGFGDTTLAEALTPNESLGRYPGASGVGPEAWALYQQAQLTPGLPNPVAFPPFFTPEHGALVEAGTLSLSWADVPGATSYQFQLGSNEALSAPLIDVNVIEPYFKPQPALPAGTYYWRVRAFGVGGWPGPWTGAIQVRVVVFAPTLNTDSEVVLGIARISQNKDSRLLCVDGCGEGNPASSATEDAWDAAAPCTEPPCAAPIKFTHGNRYCVRASIRMMASYYGGDLTMDRISYHILEEWTGTTHADANDGLPENDLGHDRGAYYPDEEDEGLSWALGTTITAIGGKPTFAQIKAWIDAGRPIMFRRPGHMMVIDGYREVGGSQFLHVLDPDQPPDFWRWQDYSSQIIDGHWPGPVSAPGVRSDETSVSSDADGDGIMDFDESLRFQTDPANADTDGDWVADKQDLREYVFNAAGGYNKRASDMDSDGARKERDADNDADGAVDGCEDVDHDGKYEAASGETDNFSAASHQDCVPALALLQPTQANPANAGAPDAPDKLLVQVRTATPPSAPPSLIPADFDVTVGGLDATVLAVYRVFDTHFLLVDPPAQDSAAFYDLEVALGGQTDGEKNAVFYLERPRADQVLVLDRSGSMLEDDKLGAAKNAARAFIDHAAPGDMIGVVSFASSAGPAPNYPLTLITGTLQYDAAKAAVNALTAGGTTALGQGAQLGYNQLATLGQADHDWSMALLSDGMENVAPYWSDPAVSGVIVPSRVAVHTVALGQDADEALMGLIAAQTGGTFYEAGLDTLAPASAPGEAPLVAGPTLPSDLPNRLADIYKSMAEEIGHQQRLAEQSGTLIGPLGIEVYVEEGLPEAIFATNWETATSPVAMAVIDPSGNEIKPGAGALFRDDATHHLVRVTRPKAGWWVVRLEPREKMVKYLFTLSAHSETTLHLAYGLPPDQRVVGRSIPILAVIADHRPIAGATVLARVQGPNGDLAQSLTLYDDGKHQDGEADDGVYGNLFTRALRPGPYVVKVMASGKNHAGESFLRYRTGGFQVLPRVAYIWQSDLSTARAYQELLTGEGVAVDLIAMADVPKLAVSAYALVIVGPDTGYLGAWGTAQALATLRQYSVPVLGLGEGGYAYFGKLELPIGYPEGAHGNANSTLPVDPDAGVWHSPYPIPSTRTGVQLYAATTHVSIHVELRPPLGMVLVGREGAGEDYYNLVAYQTRYVLWGFQAGPRAMTLNGRHLFVNVVRSLV